MVSCVRVRFSGSSWDGGSCFDFVIVTVIKQNTRQGLRRSCGNYVELQGKEKRKEEEGLQRGCTFWSYGAGSPLQA